MFTVRLNKNQKFNKYSYEGPPWCVWLDLVGDSIKAPQARSLARKLPMQSSCLKQAPCHNHRVKTTCPTVYCYVHNTFKRGYPLGGQGVMGDITSLNPNMWYFPHIGILTTKSSGSSREVPLQVVPALYPLWHAHCYIKKAWTTNNAQYAETQRISLGRTFWSRCFALGVTSGCWAFWARPRYKG